MLLLKYDRFVVFIRHDSDKTWWFIYGITLVIGTLKIMASAGVFVLVTSDTTKHDFDLNKT